MNIEADQSSFQKFSSSVLGGGPIWESLVHLGELSAARLALEGNSVAPGDDATFSVLRDFEKTAARVLRSHP